MWSDAAKDVRGVLDAQFGTSYGAMLQVVHEGRPGGSLVLVWRRVGGEWRLVAYRALE